MFEIPIFALLFQIFEPYFIPTFSMEGTWKPAGENYQWYGWGGVGFDGGLDVGPALPHTALQWFSVDWTVKLQLKENLPCMSECLGLRVFASFSLVSVGQIHSFHYRSSRPGRIIWW